MPVLRTPHPHEEPRLRTFLPAPAGACYLLAAERCAPSPERIVAAAAWWPLDGGSAGCRWRVTPRWEADGQTLAGDLLDALSAQAVHAGVRRLHAVDLLPGDGPAAARLAARGWTVASSNEFFEGKTSATWPRVAALYRRLADSADGAAALGHLQVGAPTPVWFPAIFALVSSKGLVPPALLAHRLEQLDRTGGYSRLTSRVLLTAGTSPALAAVLLMRMDAAGATIDARVADPAVCAGAGVNVGQANILLLHTVLAGLRACGVDTLRCHAHPGDHRETVNMARRLGAKQVGTACLWQRTLPPSSPASAERISPFPPPTKPVSPKPAS